VIHHVSPAAAPSAPAAAPIRASLDPGEERLALPLSSNACGVIPRAVSRAETNAPADSHRSAGFFATALSIASTSGGGRRPSGGAGIAWFTCFRSTPTGESAVKGTAPTNISYARIPRL
jgi:hypothetical protein